MVLLQEFVVREQVLEITPDHLIFYDFRPEDADCRGAEGGDPTCTANSADVDSIMLRPQYQKAARHLTINDTIFVLDQDAGGHYGRFVLSRVTHIEEVVLRRGALTLYTTTGNLFVDGALCSNFGDYYPVVALPGMMQSPGRRDLLPFALFAAHRLAFALLPSEKTARVLRWLMNTLVLPLLRWCAQNSWFRG